MRDDIDEQIREEIPSELKEKVLLKVAPALERNREREEAERPGLLQWFFQPAFLGGAAATCAALAVIWIGTQGKREGIHALAKSPVQYDLEMLAEADLLRDLDLLDRWDELKKEPKGEWKKKKG